MLIKTLSTWLFLGLLNQALATPTPPAETGSPYFVLSGLHAPHAPLNLREVSVHADISGVIARVTVTQVWENCGDKPLDGTYVFPLSHKAAVHALEMRVGGRKIVAKIKEKEIARLEFETAKLEGKRTALLEQQRPNIFATEVANIQAGELVEVEIAYVELLRPVDGIYSLVIPRVVGTRYKSTPEEFPEAPWSVVPRDNSPRRPDLFTWPVTVSLSTGVPLRWVGSSTHTVDISQDDSSTLVELTDIEPDTDRDFVLDYVLGADTVSTSVLIAPEKTGDGGHFLALVEPPARLESAEMPRDYTFIIDTSGSMQGWPHEASKELVGRLVDTLGPQDRVNVITFAGDSLRLSPLGLPATAKHKARARAFIDNASSGGGTELLEALEDALEGDAHSKVVRTIVLVTDGFVDVEAKAFDLVRERAKGATLFTVGLGDGVNRHLLDVVAHAGGGEAYVAQSEEEAEALVDRLDEDLKHPVLTDLAVSFEGFDAYDLEPRPVPTLFASRPILVTGRYRGSPTGSIIVSGHTPRGPWQTSTGIAPTSERHPAVPLIWARERIARLSDYAGEQASADHRAEVIALGLAYSLASEHTSFVLVDDAQHENAAAVLTALPAPAAHLPSGIGSIGIVGHGQGGGGGYNPGPGLGELADGAGHGVGQTKDKIRNVRLSITDQHKSPSPNEISMPFRRRTYAIRQCLTDTNRGEVILRLIALPNGAIGNMKVEAGSLGSESSSCIFQILKRIPLPKADTPRILELTLLIQ